VSVNVGGCEISVRISVKNSVSFFGVAENACKIRVREMGGVMTRRERFYVWEHDVVGHVWGLEFCPKCEVVG
jgi:hypothetical protein